MSTNVTTYNRAETHPQWTKVSMTQWMGPGLAIGLVLGAIIAAGIVLIKLPVRARMPAHPGMHQRNAWRQYYARFAILMLAFVAFDMEMAFMYPWAVAFRKVGIVAFVDMFIFVAILAVAMFYLWTTRALELEGDDSPSP